MVLVCKPSAGVEASLVLRTADASQLAHVDIPDDECRFLTVASVIVQGLLELQEASMHLYKSSSIIFRMSKRKQMVPSGQFYHRR